MCAPTAGAADLLHVPSSVNEVGQTEFQLSSLPEKADSWITISKQINEDWSSCPFDAGEGSSIISKGQLSGAKKPKLARLLQGQ